MKQLAGLLLLWSFFLSSLSGQHTHLLHDNPNPTRYFVGGAAFNIPQGTFLYKNSMLLFNSLTYGVSDQFSIGVGTELYSPVFGKGSDRVPKLFFLAPKIGYEYTSNVYISAGCEVFVFPEKMGIDPTEEGLSSAFLGYCLLTLGDANSNMTLGVYTPNPNFNFSENMFVYNIGGLQRMGKRFAFVAECFLLPEFDGIVDAGLRLYGRRSSLDLGLMAVTNSRNPVPILNYALTF